MPFELIDGIKTAGYFKSAITVYQQLFRLDVGSKM